MKINNFIKYWLPVLLYAFIIYYFSSLPNPINSIVPNNLQPYFDFNTFIYHTIQFAILNFLFYRALKTTGKNPQTLSILFTVLYAITDEIHQFYVPGRVSSVFDVAIDFLGAITMQSIINIKEWLKSQLN